MNRETWFSKIQEQRALVALMRAEGMNDSQISRELGITPRAVKARRRKAKQEEGEKEQ